MRGLVRDDVIFARKFMSKFDAIQEDKFENTFPFLCHFIKGDYEGLK